MVTEPIRASTPQSLSCATRTATPTSGRRWGDSLLSVGSSRKPNPGSRLTRIPFPFEFQLLDEDWDHFAILHGERFLHRIPAPPLDWHQEVLQRSGELHPR